jgi:phage anti-repressor protein
MSSIRKRNILIEKVLKTLFKMENSEDILCKKIDDNFDSCEDRDYMLLINHLSSTLIINKVIN